MSAPSSGKLTAHWHVFCNLCGRGDSHYRPRVILHTEAEQIFLRKGWHYVNKRWVCPDCDANAKRFLEKCQTFEGKHRNSHRKGQIMSRYPDSHFKALDASIVAAISGGTSSYSTLCTRFCPEVRVLCPDKDASRVIDRRLQTLRRAGHIVYAGSSGWKATASPPKVSVSLGEAQRYVAENLSELATELAVLWDTARRPENGRLDALIDLCRAKTGGFNDLKVAEHMICDACVRKIANETQAIPQTSATPD